MQTEATTPNIVGPRMLGVVASVLAVVWKRTKKLSTMSGPAVHRGKDTTHNTLQTICNACGWPQQCWKSCANGSNKRQKNVGSCWLVRLACIEGKNYIVIEKRLVSGIRFKSDWFHIQWSVSILWWMKPQEVDRTTHKVANFLRCIFTYFVDATKTHNLLAFVSCSVRCLISFCAIADSKSKKVDTPSLCTQ